MKIEGARFTDSSISDGRIAGLIRVVGLIEFHIRQIAINLVRRGKNQRNVFVAPAQRIEYVQGSANIDLEILARLDEACRDSHLSCHVEHGLSITYSVRYSTLVANITCDSSDFRGMTLFQPFKIALDAWPSQRIIDQNVMPLAGETLSEV